LVALLLFGANVSPLNGQSLVIKNSRGVSVEILKLAEGYAAASIALNGRPFGEQLQKGMILFRNMQTEAKQWLHASSYRQLARNSYEFLGRGKVNDARLQFSVVITVPDDAKAVQLTYRFRFDRAVNGVQASLLLFDRFSRPWTAHIYPWAENAKAVAQERLEYIGIPSLFLYRDDLSLGLLYGIDPRSDYLNPTAWTKNFGLFFKDGEMPPEWRIGDGSFQGGYVYTCPMQIVVSSQKGAMKLITDLVEEWRKLNDFQVEPLRVRTHDDALDLFLEGRKKTPMWHEGMGYQLEEGDPQSEFIYIGEQGLSAYFEYLIYEITGESLWRERSFQQADFILKAQNLDPSDINFGAFHTAYDLRKQASDSDDRGTNRGLKLDLNMHIARYLLLLWERVRLHGESDRQDWYEAAVRSVEWVLRHQNPDGGIPQKLDPTTFAPSQSVTPGRTLPALLDIVRITRSERYRRFMEDLEAWTVTHNDQRFHFMGGHPDLPPEEIEESALWNVAYYNLERYKQSGKTRYLERALGEVALAFTWNCPKQLSWVKNPTQMASAEQQHYLQYSVYNYQDMKTAVLRNLYEITGDELYMKLFERVSNSIYFTQVTSGPQTGATHERIADPWLHRADYGIAPDFNSMGTIYMGEQGLDHLLQIVLLFRLGKDVYRGRNVSNRIFADGSCTYSRDVSDAEKVPMSITPNRGSVEAGSISISPHARRWWESFQDASVSTQHVLWNLRPNTSYSVFVDDAFFRSLASDGQGRLTFSYAPEKSGTLQFEVQENLSAGRN
jgi:hypothetical protein